MDATRAASAGMHTFHAVAFVENLRLSELAPLYPRFADAVAVRDRLDPGRTFANPDLDRVLGP